jgi:outer membrane protein TolC
MRLSGNEESPHVRLRRRRPLRRLSALVLLLHVAGVPAHPETLDVTDVVERIAHADPQVLLAQSGVESARTEYRKTLGNTLPQATLSLDPAYSLDQRKLALRPPADAEESTTHRVGANLTVSQLLPTAGTVTATVGNTATVSAVGDQDVAVTQDAGATVNLVQPLFVNGKLIDLQLFDAANRLARANWTASQSRLQARTNAAVIAGLSSYAGILSLRRQAAYLQESIAIAEAQLRQLQLNRQQGRASRQDVLAAEIAVSRRRKALLDVRYNATVSERSLRRAVGLSPSEPLDLQEVLPEISLSMESASLDKSVADNPEVRQRRVELEGARLNGVLSGREFESRLTVTFAATPQYAPDREDSDDWQRSFEDLFSDDADIATTLSVKLTIPLYQGGRARRQRRIDETSVRVAERTLADTRQRLLDEVQAALMRHDLLARHIDLLEEDVRYHEQAMAEQRQLLELRNVTGLEVRQAELDYRASVDELFQAKADLFLNSLQILSLTGHDLATVLRG